MKSILTISRHWDNPKIQTTISQEGISLQIDLADFLEALHKEVGSVAWTFRSATFRTQLYEATQRVLEKVKEESVKVL